MDDSLFIVIISVLSMILIALLTHMLTNKSEREKKIDKNINGFKNSLSDVNARLLVIESEIRYITESIVFKTTKSFNDVNTAHDKIRLIEKHLGLKNET